MKVRVFLSRHWVSSGCLFLGLTMAFYTMLFSGFSQMPGDFGDCRLVQYLLEYGFQKIFFNGFPNLPFFDAPFFFPAKNTFAFSDTLLSLAPVYWVLRSFLSVETSFQIWLMSMGVLNFGVTYFFLRRIFNFTDIGAGTGAFLFAFAGPRLTRLGISHPNLWSQFFSVAAVHCLYLFLEENPVGRWSSRLAFLGFTLFLVAQFYASFNLGWFLAFSIAVGFFVGISKKAWRIYLLDRISHNWGAIVASVWFGVILLYPLAKHYLAVAAETGFRNRNSVNIPAIQAWIYSGKDSLMYGWLSSNWVFTALSRESEKRIGIGFFTLGFVTWGLWVWRKRADVRILLISTFLICLLCTKLTHSLTLWDLVYHGVPGAKAIRQVSRVGLVLLLPASIGMGFFVEKFAQLNKRVGIPTIGLLMLLMSAEQFKIQNSFEIEPIKANLAEMAAKVPRSCAAFAIAPDGERSSFYPPFYPSWKYQIDAMWISLLTGIPTVNGNSGNFPRGWNLEQTFSDPVTYRANLKRWSTENHLSLPPECMIRVGLQGTEAIHQGIGPTQLN